MKVLPLVIVLALTAPRLALACASCACGDPTLTTMGAEQTFDGRLRVGATMLTRDEEVADAAGTVHLLDLRLIAGASYAVSPRHTLSLAVPIMYRHAEQGDHQVGSAGVGGVELRWRGTLWSDRRMAARHLVLAHAGVELPSYFYLRQSGIADELWQPEQALYALGGLSWLEIHGSLSLLASALVRVPTVGDGAGDGLAVVGTAYLQWQPRPVIAVRLGVDSRWGTDWNEDPAVVSRYAHAGHGADHIEGLTLLVGPDLVWSPMMDLNLQVGVRVPVVQTGNESQENVAVMAAGVFDL